MSGGELFLFTVLSLGTAWGLFLSGVLFRNNAVKYIVQNEMDSVHNTIAHLRHTVDTEFNNSRETIGNLTRKVDSVRAAVAAVRDTVTHKTGEASATTNT